LEGTPLILPFEIYEERYSILNMSTRESNPILAFLWRSNEIKHSVVDLARLEFARAIFEVSENLAGDNAKALKAGGAKDIKISAESFMDSGFESFLQESDVDTLWVEYHPALVTCTHQAFFDRLRELSSRYRCIPISGDLEFLSLTLQSEWHPPAIALKGAEAAGFVSKETAGILYSTLREWLSHRTRKLGLIIWGGVATPEAAAAFLCSGARGVVFESLHWQTDLVSADPNMRERLSNLRPEHTAVVGHHLGVPCRFFDKGNSLAVKDLKQYEGSLFKGDMKDHDRRTFARKVKETVVPALESDLSRKDLVFLGPEASFAEGFAERFGRSTHQAVEAFIQEVLRICREAPNKLDGFVENSAARSLGTQYPFIQGAMTWISDIPEFALAVSKAGGLPTIALGLKGHTELDQELRRLKEVMGDRPYAVNFVALPENPRLDQQLAWIEQHRPPFAVIAAGEPSYAARLQEKGIQAIYVAPSEGLIRIALEAGVRFVVLEGNEAGGHIGEHTTLTLAQIALELKRREPGLFRDRYLVLAGGIFNRETAFRAFMLGADAVQMGTAYLATQEIVATGALRPLYQRLIVDSRPGGTAVSGESMGLRVRSLKTPKMDAICSLEREWALGKHDEISFRQRLETLSANSLLIAARGVERPRGRVMDEETCMREGQFMSGAVSGAVDRVRTISEFHRDLAEGPLELSVPEMEERPAPLAAPGVSSRQDGGRVAITAMAVVNSLGNTPKDVWEASLAMKSGITEVPRSRWEHHLYYDPDPRARGKTYCKVGAFQNIEISRKELGIAPQDFRSMADSTRLTLWLAEQVIKQSRLLESGIPRERIGVLVSQNSGEAAGTITDLVFDVYSHDIVRAMRELMPVTPDLETAIKKKILSGRLTVDDTTLLGRLNCAAGGFICNRYGLQGPSYSVSAACATSLVALHSAIQMIRNGIIDAAVVGGGEELLHPSHYLEFSALKALAGLSGLDLPAQESSRPFDAGRDGMVLGEGGGMIVVERESGAKGRGAPIYAYITGIGASNNDRGMVEPLAETQMIAIQASFRDAGYGADQVDLVECHATSTVQGDIEEVKALKAFFPSSNRTMLTAFKSQIGHTLGASGLINLIRGVMAMQAGVLSPTLNYRTPDPQINLEAAGFHVPVQPADWPNPPDRPRRLQVNAFGFGGANYVVQLEESREASGIVMVSAPQFRSPESHEPSGREGPASVHGVSFFLTPWAGRTYRLGVVAPNEREARTKVEALASVESRGPLSGKSLRAMARQGIFAAPADEPVKPLTFVFTGQGSHYLGMGKALYETFPEMRRWMDKIASVADFDILNLLFNSAEEDLQKTRWQQPALYTMEYAMAQYLISMGAKPEAMAGHSLGELVALSIADVFSYDDGFRIVNKRAQCMDKASGLRGDPGTMIAVDAPMEYLEEKVASRGNVYFTNFNSPHQVVLGGDTEPVLALMKEIKSDGYRATQLKVSMAFHSPIMKVIHEEMAAFVAGIPFHPARIPVVSNTTMKPFPDDPDRMRQILMAHLESPVHWMQNAKTLWDDFGVRTFVEIGPRDTLCNLVGETLEQALCIPTSMPEAEVHTYRAGVAQLYALGHLVQDGVPLPEVAERRGASSPAPGITTRVPSEDGVAAIVQREINAFVLESFGRILKPQIVEAVRRELDPGFTQERLERILGQAPASLPQGEFPERKDRPAPLPRKVSPEGSDLPAPSVGRESATAVLPSEPVPQKDREVDYVEQIIRIIMNATGYERDEIEPDMDIRQDLAIRSSRLPVIMDEVERQFDITVNVEDFVGLRTVREIAEVIERLAGQTGKDFAVEEPLYQAPLAPPADTTGEPAAEEIRQKESIKRLVLEEVAIKPASSNPLTLEPGQEVAILKTDPRSVLAADLTRLLEDRFSARPLHLDCLGQGRGGPFDLRTPEGAQNAARRLKESQSLAGLVLVLEVGPESVLSDTENIPAFLSGFFGCLKSLMSSKSKAFCLALCRGVQPHMPEAVTAEGLLGMFLAAAHEYSSVLFRSVALDTRTDLKRALDLALDTGNPLIQWIFHDQEAYSTKASNEPLSVTAKPVLELGAEDVVVISGGAKGVTFHIAQALAPFKPRVVLLGRTELDTAAAYGALRESSTGEEKGLHRLFKKKKPDPKDEGAATRAQAGLEIARNVTRLSVLGLKASYQSCDVSDPRKVSRVLDQVVKQYGRIDGIIHGAGLIKDAFMEFMTPEDFRRVVEVKLLGARNLYRASKDHGLRFFAALSSIVAIQGNVGQVNYCAANRSLSGLLRSWAFSHEGLVAKALMLPPIEGTGMAEDPEVKELMKLKGLESAFVHADELAQMFCRELFLGPPQQSWVMAARTFPSVKGTLVEAGKSEGKGVSRFQGGVRFERRDLPMIDAVQEMDLKKGEVVARRTFSQRSDLWLEDHRPFKFLKHPLVSGIMAVESFLEAAHLLYPYLPVLGVRRLRFMDILECPQDTQREARIVCRRQEDVSQEVRCDVRLSCAHVSPSGRLLDRWSTNYEGEVMLGPQRAPLAPWPDFAVKEEDLDTRPVESHEIQESYEMRTGLRGRYRVLEKIHGTGSGIVKGAMVYREEKDMAGLERVTYLYSPYLLEALMHLLAFYPAIRQEEGILDLIPAGIEEMRFARSARNGERCTLEARLRSRDGQGFTWDARAVDEDGTTIMQILSMRMNRFSQ
jgi:acyl transferase domain-containing protein/NAD(P)H-dependent flavin oxidoreductase YrpB (nitropropane dioxygenase family)/NAD(P)-dependent dehydrogenase (short-subunit alcohol dehydrogenase family)/acyl carrier protein